MCTHIQTHTHAYATHINEKKEKEKKTHLVDIEHRPGLAEAGLVETMLLLDRIGKFSPAGS